MSKVLVAGYGSAGQYVVDFLLKDHRISPNTLEEIHIMSRKSEEDVRPRLEISNVASGVSERYIPLKYHQADFNNIIKVAALISEIKPDVIVYTGRYAPGLKYGAFSYPNDIGYGVWIPLSFTYIYKLMKAVKLSGIKTKVINSSFPDGVNPLLNSIDLAPYCGAGNINHLIPRIKRATRKIFRCEDMGKIDVDLVCSHYTNTYVSKQGSEKGAKSLLTIKYKGNILLKDSYIDQSDIKKIIFSQCSDTSASGQIRNQMIATDCSEITRYLIDRSSEGFIHVPGLKGELGGARAFAKDGELTTCSSYSKNDRDTINRDGLFHDGIVINKGYVTFTDDSRFKMKSVFNIDYPKDLYLDDIEKFADKIKNTLYKISGGK